MKNIVIRTLGGNDIGYGHFYRCLSLGKAMRLWNENTNVKFLINEELISLIENTGFKYIVNDDLDRDYKIIIYMDIDLFIFDSYLGDDRYLKNIKKITKLMLIDDNNDIYDSMIPDILYNGNIHAKNLNYRQVQGQLRLLGTEYLIMKQEYWNDIDEREAHKEGILITTGGSDEHEVAIKILETIQDMHLKVKVIIGPGYKKDYIERIEKNKTRNIELVYKPDSLKQYIKYSKIVITAGGSTVYEVLSQKSIPIIYSIADNQDSICEELRNMNVNYIGKYPNVEYSNLREKIYKIQRENMKYDSKLNSINTKGAIDISKKLVGII